MATKDTLPYVICHMTPSVDGRIVTARWSLPAAAAGQYERTAALFKADAWMIGRVSMGPYAGNGRIPRQSGLVPPGDFVAPHEAKSFAIALDPSGKLALRSSDIDGEHVIAVLTGRATKAHKAYLRGVGVSYLISGRQAIDLRGVLRRLRSRFGIKMLLLEGGGKINGSMLKAGLIDELSLLVAPVADGTNGLATLFDSGPQVHAAVRLKLISCKPVAGDMVWLRYNVLKKG
jgi:riboflavin biosynthesis pyrimidine reductase